MTRYPARYVCRGDRRGVVHYTIYAAGDLAGGARPPTPAICEQFVDGLVVMTDGPLEDYPTCLRCIIR